MANRLTGKASLVTSSLSPTFALAMDYRMD